MIKIKWEEDIKRGKERDDNKNNDDDDDDKGKVGKIMNETFTLKG